MCMCPFIQHLVDSQGLITGCRADLLNRWWSGRSGLWEFTLEIGITSDLPSGTGMGGSGALAVALLHALHWFSGQKEVGTDWLANHACKLEDHSGRQDQLAAAYGGFKMYSFSSVYTGVTFVHSDHIAELERHCLLCYTGQQRDARPILEEQSAHVMEERPRRLLQEMAKSTKSMLVYLMAGELQSVAVGVSLGWTSKRLLANGITNPNIDAWYETALRNGAWGGKICGAGGGGFMLLIAPPERHAGILEALNRPQTVPVKFSTEGAKVIFDDRA